MALKSGQADPPRERSSKRRKLSPPSEQPEPVLVKKSKVSKDKKAAKAMNKPQATTEVPPSQPIVVKGLDSSEPSIRRKQLNAIIEALSSRHPSQPLDSTECLAIWRGFFVAAYMHDSKNAISVQNVLQQIASTFAIVYSKDQASDSDATGWLGPYHVAFHQTLVREWAGIDSHRMNKYLLLVRFVLRELFKICFSPLSGDEENVDQTKGANPVQSVVEVMQTAGPLNPSDRKIPDGLRLHVLDIWSDEIFGTLKTLKMEQNDNVNQGSLGQILSTLKAPLQAIAKGDSGAQKHVRQRAKDTIKDFDEEVSQLRES